MSDLDDFFAKKDRKKSKAKKFSTTDEVAKKLEDKKPEKVQKKERSPEDEARVDEHQDQDEWRDFEEEKKDYTGLKIGNLTINPEAENTNGTQENLYEQQTTYDEAGNEVEKKTGPWKCMASNSEGAAAEPPRQEEPKPEPVAPVVSSSGGGGGGGGMTYIPPGKRNQQPTQPTRGLRHKNAPDIHNEEYFPTLCGNKEQKRGRAEPSFELVSQNKSNSLRYVEQNKNTTKGPNLSLENRFNTLSNDS